MSTQFISNSAEWHNTDLLAYLIDTWRRSESVAYMHTAEKYYQGDHDILKRKRVYQDDTGEMREITALPNYRIVDNIYNLLVDQKRNYLFAKPILATAETETYDKFVDLLFDDEFRNLILDTTEDALNHGIAWLHPYINRNGEFKLYEFPGTDIIPVWVDDERKELDFAIRMYKKAEFDSKEKKFKEVEYAEVYALDGIHRYEVQSPGLGVYKTSLKFIKTTYALSTVDFVTGKDVYYSWQKVPLIPFRYYRDERPLLMKVKSLQDALNSILSTFMNMNEEDPRSSLLVVMNYDGEDRESFKRDLAAFGAVFVSSVDGIPGGVESIQVTVNAKKFKAIQKVNEQRIYAKGGGYNGKFDKMSDAPNQMNIMSMYSDIDLDSNTAELLYKQSINELLWFYKVFIHFKHGLDFSKETVKIVFNRDVLINQGQKITELVQVKDMISHRTFLEELYFIEDVDEELERIKQEREENLQFENKRFDSYSGFFDKLPEDEDEDDEIKDVSID